MEQGKNELVNGTTTISAPAQGNDKFIDSNDRTVAEEILIELMPLKQTMINALNRRGIYAKGMSFSNIVITFYNTFTKPVKPLPLDYVSDSPALNMKISEFDNLDEGFITAGMSSVPVLKVVAPAITNLLTGIKNKAQLKKAKAMVAAGNTAGLTEHYKVLLSQDNPAWAGALSAEEKLIATDVTKVETKLKTAEDSEISVTESKLKKTIIIGVVIFVLVIAVYLLFFKK